MSRMNQIWNISDVIHESKHEQNFARDCVFWTHQSFPEVAPEYTATIPAAEPVKQKHRIPEYEIVFSGPPFPGNEILRVVANNGVADVDALPIREPKPPTEINIFAVHEKKSLIEATDLLECPAADQRGGS
jgi:hypothetical protein